MPLTVASTQPLRRRQHSELSSTVEPASPPRKRPPRGLYAEESKHPDFVHTCVHVLSPDEVTSPSQQSTPSSPAIGTSRRAVLLATDIAGVPSFPDMEGELPASSYRSPPVSPVIDMSAYDLPLTVLPAPETHSEYPLPFTPSAAMLKDHPDSAALVTQPALSRPDCKYFPIFDERVHSS